MFTSPTGCPSVHFALETYKNTCVGISSPLNVPAALVPDRPVQSSVTPGARVCACSIFGSGRFAVCIHDRIFWRGLYPPVRPARFCPAHASTLVQAAWTRI
jgi:hypothetical protein